MIKSVTEYLDITAARFPDKTAYSDGKGHDVTFSQLYSKSRIIASRLSHRKFFKKPIVIAMNRTPNVLIAFMGAAYSGNFYVPIDIGMPAERVRKIFEKLQPSAFIAEQKHINLLLESGADGDAIIDFDFAVSGDIDEEALNKVAERQIDSDLLYVLFTSGSTGVPKGVAISHRGVIDYIEITSEAFDFNEETIFAQTSQFTYDLSLLSIYTVLRNGGTDYIIPKICFSFAAKMVDYLNENKVNTIYWVPTSYNVIAKSRIFYKRTPQYLKNCFFAGEVMPCSVLNVWMKALPNARYANLFGPTEITDAFVYYIIDREFSDDESVPIGKSYANVDVLILNENNELCSDGEIGELCVRSSKIGFGYYNDPELTAQVFVQNPLNTAYTEIIYKTGDLGYINALGEIMYKGRKDFLIKHAGYRIELGEIEACASAIGGIDLCACVYDDNAKRIVMFYSGTAVSETIIDVLKTQLQPYMIPEVIIKLDTMPCNINGKIDRNNLKTIVIAS